ncbi:MAG TPA: hypothetical protein ENN17_01645 [bacterium]|nr:hypothetical protein [bacterium]
MKFRTLLFLAALSILSGCDKERKAWELVRSADTIEAYQQWIAQYPESMHADSARQSIQLIRYRIARSENTVPALENFLTLVPDGPLAEKARSDIRVILDDRHPAFQRVRTILWSPTPLNAEGNYVLEKTRYKARQLFESAGIGMVNFDSLQWDACLSITAEGTALGASYRAVQGKLSGLHYTGAAVSIRFKLTMPGKYTVERSFRGTVSPSQFITQKSNTPRDAPWQRAVTESGFTKGVVDVVADVLGRTGLENVLLGPFRLTEDLENPVKTALENSGGSVRDLAVSALEDYRWGTRRKGIRLIRSLKDTTTVSRLISVMQTDKHPDVRSDACEALGDFADQCPLDIAIGALKDPHPGVRRRATFLLRKQKDPRAVEPLIDLLLDESKEVRSGADWALQDITGQKFKKEHPYHNLWSDQRKYRYWMQWRRENKNTDAG